jgi:WD40 repeat protein
MGPRSLLPRAGFLLACLAFGQDSWAQAPKEKATLKGHDIVVRSVAFSPDGKTLASGSYGQPVKGNEFIGVIKLWDLARGQERATLKGRGLGTVQDGA